MGDERAPAGPDGPVDGGDRRGLTELLTDHLTGRTAGQLAAADRIGAALLRQSVDRVVSAILAAGWRPPVSTLTTEAELAACRPGTVVTDRDGHPWVRNPAGQWCEPLPTGIYPDELLQWAPLTRHPDGPGPRTDP